MIEPTPIDRAARSLLPDVLAGAPRPPRRVSLFSSNTLFGEPGIYPEGPPMEPAVGAGWTDARCRSELVDLVGEVGAARFDTPVLATMCPAAAPRAALVLLSVTVAAPLLDAFVAGDTPVSAFGIGATSSPGRVVGPVDGRPLTARVVNERYRAEHPALMASSIAHDLLWNPVGAGQFEEATLHMICALVHLQLVALRPSLAHRGTELARRQNSLAISLVNSRQPMDPVIRVIAPDGAGTIPGGAADMQTRDFWSIPFVGGEPAISRAPRLLTAVVQRAVGSAEIIGRIATYDQVLGESLSRTGLGGALDRLAQLRATVALGLLDESMLADASGVPVNEVGTFFGVGDALECFTT